MPKRSLKWRGFGVEIEVPDRAAGALRRVMPRAKTETSERAKGILDFPASIPPLRLQRREETVERYIAGLREASPWYPNAWDPPAEGEDLAAKVNRQIWYHTVELPGGVTTPGYYDHRPLVPHYGLPADCTGTTVLDVGAWDGFWSFEFERRGATVTAVDLDSLVQTDFPPAIRNAVNDAGLDQRLGGGFEIARRALGSKVDRIVKSVYDLDPAEIGTYDIVHFADVSLHLERPLEAFRRIRSVTGGRAIIVDAYNPDLDAAGGTVTEYLGGWPNATWWIPSLNTFAQMVLDAGFSDVRVQTTYRLNPRTEGGVGRWRAVLDARP
jgi:tRNA (mo5U34)-methyltransferase